jgi:drug/metabolite transporter (DMT)-like permease
MTWLGWRRVAMTAAPRLQIARGVTLGGSAACFVFGLSLLPFATNIVLSFVSPVIVAALSAWWLGERVGALRWAAIVAGFAGVVVVVEPGGALELGWPALFPLVTASLYAVYQLLTRRIAEVDRTLPNLFWPCVVGCAMTALALPVVWTTPAPLHAAILVVHALAVAGGHVLLIRSLAMAPASLVAPFGYASLVFATLLGALVFAERPTAATIGGGALIALSGIALARSARRG